MSLLEETRKLIGNERWRDQRKYDDLAARAHQPAGSDREPEELRDVMQRLGKTVADLERDAGKIDETPIELRPGSRARYLAIDGNRAWPVPSGNPGTVTNITDWLHLPVPLLGPGEWIGQATGQPVEEFEALKRIVTGDVDRERTCALGGIDPIVFAEATAILRKLGCTWQEEQLEPQVPPGGVEPMAQPLRSIDNLVALIGKSRTAADLLLAYARVLHRFTKGQLDHDDRAANFLASCGADPGEWLAAGKRIVQPSYLADPREKDRPLPTRKPPLSKREREAPGVTHGTLATSASTAE